MTIRTYLFFFPAILFLHSPSPGQVRDSVTTEISNNALAIAFQSKPRLTGGIPIIENINLINPLVSKIGRSYTWSSTDHTIQVVLKPSPYLNVVAIYLDPRGSGPSKGGDFAGMFFSKMPEYRDGVAFWRYKPWNSWTKPMKISDPSQIEDWDTQFYYWQYEDGVYGAAIPLFGNGYRTTLGSSDRKFGSKAVSYMDGFQSNSIPCMVLGFGKDPYTLIRQITESAMIFSGRSENLVKNKSFPEPLEYLGWCTWNASSLGKNLSEETVLSGVETFTKAGFPLGWVLIDDGWFDHNNNQLRSTRPDSLKFPQGFKPMVDKLKNHYHIRHVGVWHTLNGYWNGIDPHSALGRKYKSEMFSWMQKEKINVEDSPLVTYHFIKPTSDSLQSFFNGWHAYLRDQGFTFIKVDNQSGVERMSVNNFPIEILSGKLHGVVNASAKKNFSNAMINCMDMTADAFYNFGTSAVARSVEDYFPYEEGESYNMQRGNAAAHLVQGIYNGLYFSPMVYPDLDMFQSHNPHGEFHAIARALNNGPIYITDNAGQQNFEILYKMVYHDGKIIRADQPLLPTQDCLFQVQQPRPFKAFSMSHGIGLLGIWNCADADMVQGEFSASDVQGLAGKDFALYECFSGTWKIAKETAKFPITLKRMDYQLYYIAPLKNGIAPLGLLNKYNSPATLASYEIKKRKLKAVLKEYGTFGAILPSKPKRIFVNGQERKDFTYQSGLLRVEVKAAANKSLYEIVVKI